MKKIYFLISLFLVLSIQAQVTLRITSIPANTPVGTNIYLIGSINAWDAANTQYLLQPDGLGARTITIPEGTGTVGYKFTRGGSWSTVEGNASGGFLPDRSFTFTGSPQTINLTIQSWEDIAGSGSNSTAAANVQILSNAFFMPQLNRNRRIWIYLPPDYYTTTKTYPVLYMQDGQSLFDESTSFSGEWGIDESLNTLHSQGNYGAIVVGIDNGGDFRLNEYSPWVNPNYGGGDGDAYMRFLGETLKPYIDANFRTRPQAQFNAIIGSSMGALISTYGAVKYPNLFSKVGVFSPSFWFAPVQLNSYINNTTNDLSGLRLYFVCGQNESAAMVSDMNTVQNILVANGVSASNTFTKVDADGIHHQSYWRREFPAAYQWLFQNVNLSNADISIPKIEIFQMNSNQVYCSGLQHDLNVDVYSVHGQKMGSLTLQNGTNDIDLSLSNGIYILKSTEFTTKFIK
ncbi:alpha/beta hydrolase-fold protein [Flavobacterium wongokense]|uniref:alpha/beta hydrolase-fold protein n=1 Tax=Flavobacterium wongokense TaxID=2910674 RepID=UPI001EEA964F|nr:alpha/beta hydrolase-fold protein [Flavobacterium sp. WG47]MCF6131126.1 T9SS type A sorting domain-containing protein [Flavobacterium sp. WG47]